LVLERSNRQNEISLPESNAQITQPNVIVDVEPSEIAHGVIVISNGCNEVINKFNATTEQ